ncbi:MAG: hypothetical protein IPM54_30120 [Polyangiaceae bacterium]|nr:hypothetical protein [Polyangiaceae bacterium]
MRHPSFSSLLMALLFAGCGTDPAAQSVDDRTRALLDFESDLTTDARFYDFPFPSDLRLTAQGAPDYSGVPHPSTVAFWNDWTSLAMDRRAFPTVPVAYFRFTRSLAPLDHHNVVSADKTSPILLIDIDPDSPERGRMIPTVAVTPEVDAYVPEHMLEVAPRPGFVLHENRKYAFVVMTSLLDERGEKLAPSTDLEALRSGKTASGPRGANAAEAYAPLWETLSAKGINAADVASATVFTTGDVVADTYEVSEKVRAARSITIENIQIDPDDGSMHDRYCELVGTIKYPQFQKGTPPFDKDGLFEIDASGVPVLQREESAPITIVIPKQMMPAGGYPLMMYFHGSGGVSGAVVDRGTWKLDTMDNTKGEGPGFVLAPFNIASVGSALPVNPERLPGASEQEYLNLKNVVAMRDTFRQGVIEQRLLLDAMLDVKIDPSVLAGCAGPLLPPGETAFRFAADKVVAQGQSMGGMYTNMISAVEPRIRAAVPTGAGGFWTYYVLQTTVIDNAQGLLGVILATQSELTFMHPALSMLQAGLEPADPFVYMPRVGLRPLDGAPARPIYEPVGKGDSYFSTDLYNAVALSYGHQQAGNEVWPEMQEVLALWGLSGILPYPVKNNRASAKGTPYTGVVVQYEGDGIYDPHAIYTQLDAVKYQYGCFLSTFLSTGSATVPAPAPLGTPCPN